MNMFILFVSTRHDRNMWILYYGVNYKNISYVVGYLSSPPLCYETCQLSCGLPTNNSICSDYYDADHINKSSEFYNPWQLKQSETVMVNTAVESKVRLGRIHFFVITF